MISLNRELVYDQKVVKQRVWSEHSKERKEVGFFLLIFFGFGMDFG